MNATRLSAASAALLFEAVQVHPQFCAAFGDANDRCGNHYSPLVTLPATAGRWRAGGMAAEFPYGTTAAVRTETGRPAGLVGLTDPVSGDSVEVLMTPDELRAFATSMLAQADLAEES